MFSGDIVNGEVKTQDIADDGVNAQDIATAAVRTQGIATEGVRSVDVEDNGLTGADIREPSLHGVDAATLDGQGPSDFLTPVPGKAAATNEGNNLRHTRALVGAASTSSATPFQRRR